MGKASESEAVIKAVILIIITPLLFFLVKVLIAMEPAILLGYLEITVKEHLNE